ncbi:MAG: hypothetical protein J3K34DRAFT_10778 [Monoraphidium minutum]|nr:MAG: hypothetical protein J3K34DRAFT_10778 [Monoraphidium minutum]
MDASLVALAESAGPSGRGRALIATRDAPKGCVLMAVPRAACIVIDYASEQGASLPAGEWPRLRQGVNFREPLTWDLLQALAIMDAAAGDGGGFWGAYAAALLPAPEEMGLPLCWGPELLRELQHPAIEAGAAAQQERLARLFPAMAAPAGPGAPSWLQWAFACVRSRAFKVGPEAWATIPFLDMANHATDPNADFAAALPPGAGGGGDCFYLIAVEDIKAGDEITISYTGPEGYTNQRLMAQYGFVPAGGNMADRLALEPPPGACMSMERVETLLGSGLLMEAAQGRNPYLFAALKSLPLELGEEGGGGAATPSSSGGGGGGGGGGGDDAAGRRLAAALLEAVASQVAAAPTTLEADEALLAALSEGGDEGRQGEGSEAPRDGRLAAAVRYRVERKRLLAAARVVLAAYARGGGGGGGASPAA